MIDQLIIILTICALVAYWVQKKNSRLPPGPIRLPVLGSLIQLHQAHPVYSHLALAKLSEKYGDIMSFGYGMHTAVIVSSFEALQDIFKSYETNANRFEFPFVADRNYGKNLGLIWSSGQRWIDVRRYTKKIFKEFGYAKSQPMDLSLNDSANQLVDCIKTDLLNSPGNRFFVSPKKFAVHVLNVVWNISGGYKFDPTDENLLRNMECVDKVDHIFGHSNIHNMLPFLKTWFPKQMHYAEDLKIHNEIHEFTESLIDDAKKKRSQRLDSEPISFIEVFLDKIEECREESDTLFTHEQLVIILEDLFFGGLETTGTLLAWSLLFLIQNNDVQVKFRKELLAKLNGRTDLLPAVELKAIPYVKATVLEVMRVGNMAPIPVPRTPIKDIKIRNYLIPKGSVLFYNLYVMYNDKSFWKDPENFRPERFITENGQIDKIRSDRILNTVFGIGPRVCFGEAVAIDSLFTFLSAMIINFEFDKNPGEELTVKLAKSGLVLAPERFCVKITTLS